jgi:hypothetical protein
MNNLVRLYNYIKTFSDSHQMVNEFVMVGSEDEINQREFDYRTLIMMPLQANLSRDLNSPVYTLDFGIIVIDKTIINDDIAYISSTEENVNVIGQLQDYLMQEGLDVDFESVEITTGMAEDYNVTIAMSDFSVTLARSTYLKDINV